VTTSGIPLELGKRGSRWKEKQGEKRRKEKTSRKRRLTVYLKPPLLPKKVGVPFWHAGTVP